MAMDTNFRAIVHIQDNPDEHNDLKRLALFFDEIHFILPQPALLKGDFFSDSRRGRVNNDGSIEVLDDINLFQDITPMGLTLSTDSLENSQLRETLLFFEKSGIARNITETPKDDTFEHISNIRAYYDMNDKTYCEISGFKPGTQSVSAQILEVKVHELEELVTLVALDLPEAVASSYETTRTLYLSSKKSLFPVFLQDRHKLIMEYRYNQYKKGLEFLQKFESEVISPLDFKTQFGEITFNVANSIFTSDLVSRKTPEQIMKYRNEMSGVRRKFVSESLMEVALMVQESPWNIQAKKEIERYIFGKLNQNILLYNEKSRETWEKLFGTVTIHLAEVIKSSAIGGGAGGLLGNIIPNTSAWHMLLLGTIAGVATEAPSIAKDIIEMILENRRARRSSIAYLARFR